MSTTQNLQEFSRPEENQETAVLEKLEKQQHTWNRGAKVLHGVYILLGITFVVSSSIVAAFTEELGTFGTRLLASTSAISASLIQVTGVGRKGNEFRTAERKLRIAILRFNEGEIQKEELIKELEEAESLISDVQISIQKKL
ncbi:MAG: hypothetical protein AAGA83_05555 [Cyanobacteria bacterium P01_F01_bin.116]